MYRKKRQPASVSAWDDVPLFSGNTKSGNLVFIVGKETHVAPFTIEAHADIVLEELEKELIIL